MYPSSNQTSSFRDAPLGAGPESITPNRGYGFRVRSLCSRPGMTGYGDDCSSIHPRLGRNVLHVVGHGVVVHRAIIDGGGAALVDPGQRVLHPVLVVARGEIFASIGAAAFGAIGGR